MEPKTRKTRINPEIQETQETATHAKDPHFDLRIEQYKARGLTQDEYCLDCGWQYAKDPVAGVNICPINKPDCNRNGTPIDG